MNKQIAPNLRLRYLRRTDIAAAARLAAAAFDSTEEGELVAQMMNIHCDTVENIALNEQKNVMVANEYYVLCDETAHAIIGLSGLYRNLGAHRDIYSLNWFCMAPDRQRQGLGRMLLEATMHKAISLGGTRMMIETWPESTALTLYTNLGFEECGRVTDYYEPDMALLLLTRSLRDVQFELPAGMHYDI